MDIKKSKTKNIITYISTVLSWTIFCLLLIIGSLLVYYYISVKLYTTKGDKYEPKFSVYTIVSQSMEPTIKVYDVIINTKIDSIEDVKVNDVITFVSTCEVTNGMTITHRVIGSKVLDNGEKCLITRGDNNTQIDQSCVKEGNIIGVAKGIIPGLGKLQFFITSKFGWLFLIVLPAIYIVLKSLLQIFNIVKKDNNRKYRKEDKNLVLAYKKLIKIKKKFS